MWAAWDFVSNPERWKEYEMKRMVENELSWSVNEFLSKLQDDLKEEEEKKEKGKGKKKNATTKCGEATGILFSDKKDPTLDTATYL